eukprot:INCI6187.11.p3 GENE.INCI6187.11~~INCI6187.11.p3  ORF type:complete len:104 (-),score=22.44 INCI6187.11:356-667(-)
MTTNSWQLQPRDYSTKQPQQQQQLQQAQQQGNSDNENMKTTNTKHNNDYHDHGSATCQYGNDNRHEVAAQQQQRAEAGRQRHYGSVKTIRQAQRTITRKKAVT